jgi:hypothetical protein
MPRARCAWPLNRFTAARAFWATTIAAYDYDWALPWPTSPLLTNSLGSFFGCSQLDNSMMKAFSPASKTPSEAKKAGEILGFSTRSNPGVAQMDSSLGGWRRRFDSVPGHSYFSYTYAAFVSEVCVPGVQTAFGSRW